MIEILDNRFCLNYYIVGGNPGKVQVETDPERLFDA